MSAADPLPSPSPTGASSTQPAPKTLWPTLLQAPPWRDKAALPPMPDLHWQADLPPAQWHWALAKARCDAVTGSAYFYASSSTWDFLRKPQPELAPADWNQRAKAALAQLSVAEWLAQLVLPAQWPTWPSLQRLLWACGVPADQVARVAGLAQSEAQDFGPMPEGLYSYQAGKLLIALPPRLALGYWLAHDKHLPDLDGQIEAVRLGGEAVAHTVLRTARSPSRDALLVAHGMAWAPLAPWAASGLGPVRWRHQLAQSWLLAFPQVAALGLWASALTPADARHAAAWHALRLLHDHGHSGVLQDTLQTGLAHLPVDEQQAAWDAALTRLNAAPERWLPTPLPKLTKALDALFASAQPLVLKACGANGERLVLPTETMRDALMVLMLGDTEAPYVGLAQLQDACRPESLAAWARELFELWAAEGMHTKGRFLLPVQGWLGDDATATRMQKGIVAWRAKLDRVRAYDGITALSRMGGKAALTWLAALADQKRYNDLQSRASQALQAAAELREMSMEELADCTLPELGFDAHSRQLLDFGPRQFELLLDEQLQTRLRELAPAVDAAADPSQSKSKSKAKKAASGWLKTLPKPRIADDAELAAQAKRQLKDVTTQLKALGKRQLQRMEAAMCSERRWMLVSFQQNLVAHPIARVLTQRLVFGVYSALPPENKAAGLDTPLQLFRVAEDGSAADGQDQPLAWDALAALSGDSASACIGVVHPAAIAAMANGVTHSQAFASLLADYELLQPFEQLGREVADMPPAWLTGSELADYQQRQIGTGSLLGLMGQGWQRQVGDGGMVDGLYLSLPGQLGVTLSFEPGWFVAGGVDTGEGQTVTGLQLIGSVPQAGRPCASDAADATTPATWGDLSPIARSELMRSLNRLAWWQRP